MADRENPDFLSASTLQGDKVTNTAGEDLGKIEDLMLDLDNGRIAYAVLSFGGWLGMGDKLFAIPWQALKLKLHDHAFVLDIPKETLQNAQGFDKDNWPITSREWVAQTYSYYGYQPYWQRGVTEQTSVAGETAPERIAATERSGSRENPDFLSADTLKGDKVINRSGHDVGKIEEFMIDLENGKVGYVVVSHGGFLGLGDKYFAIPWQAFHLRVHEHAFSLDVPKDTLDKAHGFDKDKWPLTREALSRVYDYYGYKPYWLTEAAATGVSSAAGAAAAGVPHETEQERTARLERKTPEPTEVVEERIIVKEKVAPTKTEERVAPTKTEEEIKAQEQKISKLEKERAQREKQAQDEREKLAKLERERVELERQAEAERQRLDQLERDLQEARRQEETEKVTRLEKELTDVRTQEESRKEKLAQLEWQCSEARKQAESERERLAQLEKERTEVERQATTQRELVAQLERERTEVERRGEAKPERGIPDFLSASTIKTDRVVNTAGEDLGRIEELMIDLDNGRVAYAVLSFGGFLGMSDKFFAIPWQALTCRAHEHAFTLDIPKDVLERAEGFDKGNWPLSYEALSRTYTYYGYQPYWQREGTERTRLTGETETERMARTERHREEPLETAEERIARQDVERIEKQEATTTDKEKMERLERDKVIAERRENKYK